MVAILPIEKTKQTTFQCSCKCNASMNKLCLYWLTLYTLYIATISSQKT